MISVCIGMFTYTDEPCGVGLLLVSATTTSLSTALEDDDPEQVVLMLAGVPRELDATLDAHELSEVNVSARDRPGTSWRDGGEMERLARWCRY